MESLRWILLAAGVVFVLVIYILGRSRRNRKHSMVDDLDEDLPEFSAKNLDDVDEGVGEVRVVTGGGLNADVDDLSDDNFADIENEPPVESTVSKMPSDFIVLYILPKNDPHGKAFLTGAEINSSAQAMGLSFGEMNIFHYKPDGQTVFSLANMLEPGSFDADTIHDLKTSGLTVFMKIKGDDPMDDLTEMLQRSYQLAGLLDARLCSHTHETLTEQNAEDYRTQVSHFINGETPELSTET